MDKTQFVRSYIETALWSSTDDDGTPLDDAKYAEVELAPETVARFEKDCSEFQADIAGLDVADYNESRIAHDFWLTRNHHGAGFWDGDYPKELGQRLTDLAYVYGECDLYVGDDGKLYC